MFRNTLLLAAALLSVFAGPAMAVDRDGDAVDDAYDNCVFVPNADQRDTDRDGFGNRCDADLDGDGAVTVLDFAPFSTVLFSADEDADFDGDGVVGTIDFALFLQMLGRPAGPGAVLEDLEPIVCNGGFCTIFVAPGIDLDVAQGDFSAVADGTISVNGDAEIYTPEGGVRLEAASLVVTPGEGMVGTSYSPDYSIGTLAGTPSTLVPNRVDVMTARGRELELEIPLWDDVHYVVFSDGAFSQASVETGIGVLRWAVGPQSWRLVLDPVDPFIYVGSDDVIPVLTSRSITGIEVLEIGRGLGFSLGGRIAFAPSVPAPIAEVLPEIGGDTIYYASFNATPFVPLLETPVEGVVIVDEDPDGNGARIFGSDAASARDYRRVVDGTIGQNFVLSILPGLSFDVDLSLEPEPLPITVISSFTGVGTVAEQKETWLSLGLADVSPVETAANGWVTMPSEETATVFYFNEDSDKNFFRAATERVVGIDSRRMAQTHGVDADVLEVSNSFMQIGLERVEFSAESFARSIHPDVEFTSTSRTRLILPTSDESAFDLTIETDSRIGGVSLDQYGMQLTLEAYRHWGRYETPNYVYTLAGEVSEEGAWLEGSARAPLPYRYPAVNLVADVAGRIAAQEQVVMLAEAEFDLRMDRLIEYETALSEAANDLRVAQSALSSARSWLSEKRDELADMEDYDCGTCRWYDAVCWARVGTCNTWKAGRILVLENSVRVATASVTAAQATANGFQSLFDEAAVLVAGAQNAVELAVASRDEARIALVALRAERDSLPRQDGVIDATVRLRLTRDGLTGAVSGTFNGVDFGEGQVVNDAEGPRACFVVPQTGEPLCADL